MIFSRSAEYGIQAMIYLASKNDPGPVMIGEIAEGYNIPKQFLAKITQILSRHHLLQTVRGRKGGVKLARPANEIYLPEIIHAIDGPPPVEDPCIFGLDKCADEQPCPLHHRWEPIRDEITDMLSRESLEKLAERVAEKHRIMEELGLT